MGIDHSAEIDTATAIAKENIVHSHQYALQETLLKCVCKPFFEELEPLLLEGRTFCEGDSKLLQANKCD